MSYYRDLGKRLIAEKEEVTSLPIAEKERIVGLIKTDLERIEDNDDYPEFYKNEQIGALIRIINLLN